MDAKRYFSIKSCLLCFLLLGPASPHCSSCFHLIRIGPCPDFQINFSIIAPRGNKVVFVSFVMIFGGRFGALSLFFRIEFRCIRVVECVKNCGPLFCNLPQISKQKRESPRLSSPIEKHFYGLHFDNLVFFPDLCFLVFSSYLVTPSKVRFVGNANTFLCCNTA